ncbi:transglycosylase domain-containing protein [Metabacillus iocasae]|uniref:1A family penicillin-binding protein n=1 Tax=Priestia iocasae TaxID=2291674 RepID=A0ABS2QX91_9BACI|nr:transglycosylase domain-containing protein [Metabacillus iocasae]MBM7704100.1 1A family penicillin-binding protein [Metabacillus iocasae]
MEAVRIEQLKRARKYLRMIFVIAFILLIFSLFIIASIVIYAKIQGPPPLTVPQTVIFYTDDGDNVLDEVHHGEKRYWVSLGDISPFLLQATLSVEDKRFYQHHGFDYKRIAGALLADIKAMSKVQGASTITQQYARNLFLEHDKTWKRKMEEAFYTIRLEANYDKNRILEGYLNTIYYGHGAYGIEAASRAYFGKSASNLTLSEATLLAGIPKGPSYYSPLLHFDNAKKRQQIILNMMVEDEFISKELAHTTHKENVTFTSASVEHKEADAPYFLAAAMVQLKDELHIDEQMIQTKGLRVYTTLDATLQKIAEEKMDETISAQSSIQAAFVAMNPKNGEVKALIGGRDYTESPFNRATQAVRQPGSTMKPLLYYAALEDGFTPSTVMRSERTTFTFDDGASTYTPSNFNHYYAKGPITLAQAIALSDNVYAVKTHLFIGQHRLVETAKKMGITTPLKRVPSLALGTSPVKVIEMVNAYSILANGGAEVKPTFIRKVETYDGELLYEAESEKKQVLDEGLASVATHLMTGMFSESLNGYTTITGKPILKYISRPYAGKSGSTSTDSWMIGYSPELVSGVWTGYDKGKSIDSVPERSYAKKMWVTFMEEALRKQPISSFEQPKEVKKVKINPENGLLATDACPVKHTAYYMSGTEPTEQCTDHLYNSSESAPTKEKTQEKTKWYKKWLPWFN